MSSPPLSSAPFTHDASSVPRTMLLVILALMPATLFGLYQFGWPAIILFSLTLLSVLVFEALALVVARKPVRPFLFDGSALLTGWLLALSMPPWAPWWLAVLGGFIAIIIGKQIYGGLGQNIFNPAMVARVALLASFPLEMTFYTKPQPLGAEGSPGFRDGMNIVFGDGINIDAMSSATTLTQLKVITYDGTPLSQVGGDLPGVYDSLFSVLPGSIGELSPFLLLIGGLFLILMRVITWHTPAAVFAGLFLTASLFHLIDPDHYPTAGFHLVSGAVVLGAFFIATDYVTQPVSHLGRLIFGFSVGVLIFFVRTFSIFPEGMGFAILLMNGLTPMLDHYIKPRIFGRTRAGRPLPKPRVGEGQL